ncbi:MAG: transposase [Gammaproteobacteria bacterium]|nr:transposase [Gammaproteobacteria bacterium]
MEINAATVGLDLAKISFHVFCADENGYSIERKQIRRKQVLEHFGRLSPCTVAMETCSGANWWCRKLRELGHDARLIPAAYVKQRFGSEETGLRGEYLQPEKQRQEYSHGLRLGNEANLLGTPIEMCCIQFETSCAF